jgi:hypothetical protein
MPATGGSDDSGKVVVDIAGVQRASVRLADTAQAYDQLAARIRKAKSNLLWPSSSRLTRT